MLFNLAWWSTCTWSGETKKILWSTCTWSGGAKKTKSVIQKKTSSITKKHSFS